MKVSLLRPALASEPSIAPRRAPGFSLMPTGPPQACVACCRTAQQRLDVAAHDRERHHAEVRQRRVAPANVGHVEKDAAEVVVRGVPDKLRAGVGDSDKVLACRIALDSLDPVVEVAVEHLRFSRGARLRRHDEQGLADADFLLQMANGGRHRGVKNEELRIALLRPEGAGQHLGAQAGTTHAQHDGKLEPGFADLVGKGNQFAHVRLHGFHDIQPAQRVADDGLVLRVALPQRGIFLPHARHEVFFFEAFQRVLEVLFVRPKCRGVAVDGTARHFVAPGFNHPDQLFERIRERLDALFGQLVGHGLHVNADGLQLFEDVLRLRQGRPRGWARPCRDRETPPASAEERC